jgi:isochorismate pyruvate lyase
MGPFPLTIRSAERGDVPRLIEVGVASCLDFSKDLPGFERAPQTVPDAVPHWVGEAGENILVVERGGVVVGWTKTSPQTGEIEDLWMDPGNHGEGISGLLLSAAEAQVKAQRHSLAWLTTHAQKAVTMRFYRMHGYALLDIDKHASTQSVPGVVYPRARLGKQLSRPNASAATSMADVRVGIDTLDPMLVSLVAERFAFIDRAADLKPAVAMPARVQSRVEEVVANAKTAAISIGFDPDLTEKLWRTMIDLAIDHEEAKMAPVQSKAPDESAA